jgi:ubiquinol-cytochrome c reductase iron-sulfur subunit
MTAANLKKQFGLLSEYNERKDKKLTGTHLMPEAPLYHVTPTRPGNFGDHIDFKINIDNFFEENRCPRV